MNLNRTMNLSIFAPPDVLPAQAPINIMIRVTTVAKGPHEANPGVDIPVDEIIERH